VPESGKLHLKFQNFFRPGDTSGPPLREVAHPSRSTPSMLFQWYVRASAASAGTQTMMLWGHPIFNHPRWQP